MIESKEVRVRRASPLEVARLPYQVGNLVVVLTPDGDYSEGAAGELQEIQITDDPKVKRMLLARVKHLRNGSSELFPYTALATRLRTAH